MFFGGAMRDLTRDSLPPPQIKDIDATLHLIDNDDNADAPVLRIRLTNASAGAGASGDEDPVEAATRALSDPGDQDERALRDLEQVRGAGQGGAAAAAARRQRVTPCESRRPSSTSPCAASRA